MTARGGAESAGLARRLGASVYEALLLTALLVGIGFALLPLLSPAPDPRAPAATAAPTLYLPTAGARAWSGALLCAACGVYCIGLWSGGRRTLPMQTWRLELKTTAGSPLSLGAASVRFLACWIGPLLALGAYAALQPIGLGRFALPLLALNYLWALADPERAFLQDRLAGTRLRARPPARG